MEADILRYNGIEIRDIIEDVIALYKVKKETRDAEEWFYELQKFNQENTINGEQTWQVADKTKDNLDYMKRCCVLEIKSMAIVGLSPAPYYFERVAILSRKQKDYKQEIYYCEQYINILEVFYSKPRDHNVSDTRKGPRYKNIVNRLPKAKELLAKTQDV